MPRSLAGSRLIALAALVGLAAAAPSSAQDKKKAEQLSASWQGAEATSRFGLERKGGSYRGEVTHEGEHYRLRLRERDGRWELQLNRRTLVGAAQRVGGGEPRKYRYRDAGALALDWAAGSERVLVGQGLRIEWPETKQAKAGAPNDESPRDASPKDAPLGSSPDASDPESGEPQDDPVAPAAPKPVIKVLLTGFDRFPKLRNHPRWVQSSVPEGERLPDVNPAGWAVRHFDPGTLSPELLERAEIQVLRLNDLPVVYVDAAQAVIEAIGRLEPDVVISFGVGANGSADVDVERRCSNLMRDGWGYGDDQDRGPFQLSTTWPPATPRSQWSSEDSRWLSRYPDNAGVSYAGAEIVPGAPETLTSTLPVDRIVAACRAAGLRPIDGGSGPGEYICNNVMFQVIRTQAARGKLGGFIHLRSWSEDKQGLFLTAVKCAVEGSVEQVLADRFPATIKTGPR